MNLTTAILFLVILILLLFQPLGNQIKALVLNFFFTELAYNYEWKGQSRLSPSFVVCRSFDLAATDDEDDSWVALDLASFAQEPPTISRASSAAEVAQDFVSLTGLPPAIDGAQDCSRLLPVPSCSTRRCSRRCVLNRFKGDAGHFCWNIAQCCCVGEQGPTLPSIDEDDEEQEHVGDEDDNSNYIDMIMVDSLPWMATVVGIYWQWAQHSLSMVSVQVLHTEKTPLGKLHFRNTR